MELANDWMMRLLQGALPPDFVYFLHEHLFDSRAPAQVAFRTTSGYLHQAFGAIMPVVEPLMDRVTQALYDSPDIVVLIFVVLLFLVMFQILAWMKRLVMWWTRMLIRVTFLAGVVLIVAMAVNRGPEESLRAVVVTISKLIGFASAVKDIWLQEYRKYAAQGQGGPPPRSSGAGWRGY